MEYFPSPDHLRHASHPLDKDHTSGRRRESPNDLRPLSTRIPAGPAQDFGQDTNRNPGRTKVGLPTRTPTTSPRKDARKARKRPRKGPERPKRARPAGPHKAQRKGQRRPPKATRNPPPPPSRRRSQPATKEPQERPGKAHGRPRTGPAVQDHRPTAEAKERPKKGQRKATTRGPTPCRLWLPCRVEGCRTVILDKPGVCVVYWL